MENKHEQLKQGFDALVSLRDQKLKEAKECEQKAISLDTSAEQARNDAETLRTQAFALTEAIKGFGVVNGVQANGAPQNHPALAIGKYSSFKLSPAILDVVQLHGTAPGLLPAEIVKRLQSDGFNSEAKNFYASAYSVARQLAERGKLKLGKKDGKISYMKI